MTTVEAREDVKTFLYIPTATTAFDTEVDDFVQNSVDALWPHLKEELTPDTSLTLASGDNEFPLPAGMAEVYQVEIYDSDLEGYTPIDGTLWRLHKGVVYLQETYDSAVVLRLFGFGRYDLTDVPVEFELVVSNWAASNMYQMFAGDKRKYNIYSQVSGRSGVSNMLELSNFHYDRGNEIFRDRLDLRAV